MPMRNHHQDLKTRLASKEYAALYIEAAFRESCRDQHWAAFGAALRNVIGAQKRDVAKLARDSGVSRQHIYRLFGEDTNPTLSTLVPVLEELNLSMSILPHAKGRKKSTPV